MPTSIKCVLYARCSTLLNQDPEHQLVPLRQVAQARGFEIVEEFVDHGISGTRESRPALSKLQKSAMQGRFTVVMCSALDRIGRNTKHVLQLMDDLSSYGVSLISLREGLDFSTPTGKMVLTVLSAVASLEAAIISERIKTALAVKKLAAEKTGNGWRCGRKPLELSVIEKIRALHGSGKSIRAIAREVEVGKSSVERVLRGRR